jgi:hypothetical protein
MKSDVPAPSPAPRLQRETFRTSRLLEFCSVKELTAQTGHGPIDWPLCILKELADNGIDACEEAGIAPQIVVKVSTTTGEISISDNGPGIPSDTITGILDYNVRVSSREAYCSPSRGAQGNALKTILAMAFALSGERGETIIEAQGLTHRIVFQVDHVRQAPRILHEVSTSSVKNGTAVRVRWPQSACSMLPGVRKRFLQILGDYRWLNPHLAVRLRWDDKLLLDAAPTDPAWRKWAPSDPTSAHWYDLERFERYISAHVARDQDLGRDRKVREFIAEFRGFSGSAKQKVVLEETDTARMSLSAMFGGDGQIRHDLAERLLYSLRQHSRSVKPRDLGTIGRDHLFHCLRENGGREETLKYQASFGDDDGLPWAVEAAFGWSPGVSSRHIVVGINWSIALGNPFRALGGSFGPSLNSILTQQRAGVDEPIVLVLHFACPRVDFTDRGKTAAVIR